MGDLQGHEFRGNQWSAQGAVSPRDAVARVQSMPSGVFGRASFPVPFPVDSAAAQTLGDVGPPKIEDVPIHTLVATQSDVSRSGVMHKLASEVDRKEPIDVVRRGGKNYIWDGHHRAVASAALGERTIRASVLEGKRK